MSDSKSKQIDERSIVLKTVRVPKELSGKLAAASADSGQSENAWILDAIRYWFAASKSIRDERRKLLQGPDGDILAAEEGGGYGGKKPPKKGRSKP